jgi:alpha-ribazole phosphatase
MCYGQTDMATRVGASTAAAAVANAFVTLSPSPCAAVYTSPWRRTREVAERLAARWDVPLRVDARLSELSFGEWEGRAYADLERTDAERLHRWMQDYEHVPPPGGETAIALVARVSSWLDEVRALGTVILAVTHAGPIRAARALVSGEPYSVQALSPVAHLELERF